MTGWIITTIIIAAALWGVAIYNSLVALKQRNRQAFADIDVQLRQRHDL
ncbi:MAG TPA: LemA family protein, partial [Aestuariivirgaceae bacterium]